MSLNGVPVARHGLIFSEHEAIPSRMFFIWVSGSILTSKMSQKGSQNRVKIFKNLFKNVTWNPDTFYIPFYVDFGPRPPSKTTKNEERVVKLNTFMFFGSGQILTHF